MEHDNDSKEVSISFTWEKRFVLVIFVIILVVILIILGEISVLDVITLVFGLQ